MPMEFLDAQQRDERRFKKIAILLFMVFLSVLTTYVAQYIGYVDNSPVGPIRLVISPYNSSTAFLIQASTARTSNLVNRPTFTYGILRWLTIA